MTPDDIIYGHPNQVQPSHMVITSPYYDWTEYTREDQRDVSRLYNNYANGPIKEILELRARGWSYQKIADRLELTFSTVYRWYRRATGDPLGTDKKGGV